MRAAGVIIAGGASTRFGSPKALASVGGRRVIDRVEAALRDVVDADDIFAMINDAGLAGSVALKSFRDVLPGAGALSGLHGALVHARDLGFDAILAVGCDMPFLSASLLREVLHTEPEADAVLPASDGPRGVEPLCARYGITCIAAIESALSRGDARMIGFHADIRTALLPLARVREHGDPARLFFNLNTQADLERAEQLQ